MGFQAGLRFFIPGWFGFAQNTKLRLHFGAEKARRDFPQQIKLWQRICESSSITAEQSDTESDTWRSLPVSCHSSISCSKKTHLDTGWSWELITQFPIVLHRLGWSWWAAEMSKTGWVPLPLHGGAAGTSNEIEIISTEPGWRCWDRK